MTHNDNCKYIMSHGGINMISYSDVDFAEVVSDKVGNVAEFKKALRKYGLIGRRKQLTDEHIKTFKEAQKLQAADMTWWGAFDTVLEPLAKELDQNQFGEQHDADLIEAVNRLSDNLEVMNRILLRIEKKL
jgi:hypothetical protein